MQKTAKEKENKIANNGKKHFEKKPMNVSGTKPTVFKKLCFHS